jgi:hypothetical protein
MSEKNITVPARIWSLIRKAGRGIDNAGEFITEPILERIYARRDSKAMENPEYADIEERRRSNGSYVILASEEKNLGMDEWDMQDAIRATIRTPWYTPFLNSLQQSPVSHFLSKIEHAYQRVTRGWDDTALWSADSHLCKTLGEQLAALADISHGYPAGGEFSTYEEWQQVLREHSARLLAYEERWDYSAPDWKEREAQLTSDAKDSLRWVAEHLEMLWD